MCSSKLLSQAYLSLQSFLFQSSIIELWKRKPWFYEQSQQSKEHFLYYADSVRKIMSSVENISSEILWDLSKSIALDPWERQWLGVLLLQYIKVRIFDFKRFLKLPVFSVRKHTLNSKEFFSTLNRLLLSTIIPFYPPAFCATSSSLNGLVCTNNAPSKQLSRKKRWMNSVSAQVQCLYSAERPWNVCESSMVVW